MSKVIYKAGGVYQDCVTKGNRSVFNIVRNQKETVYSTGGGSTTYRKFTVTRGGKTAPATILYESEDPETDYITITAGAPDPNAPGADKQEKRNLKELQIATTVSKSGIFGKLVDEADKAFVTICDEKDKLPATDPEYIQIYSTMRVGNQDIPCIKREYSTGVKRSYSTKSLVPIEIRGKPRPDPKIVLNCDFGTWPASSYSAGKRKMIVRDFDKPISGTNTYEEATIMIDGCIKRVDETNAYMFLTTGSRIYKMITDMGSVSLSEKYASNRKTVTELLVRSMSNDEVTVIDDDGTEYTDKTDEPQSLIIQQAQAQPDAQSVQTVADTVQPVATQPVATLPVAVQPVATQQVTQQVADMMTPDALKNFVEGL